MPQIFLLLFGLSSSCRFWLWLWFLLLLLLRLFLHFRLLLFLASLLGGDIFFQLYLLLFYILKTVFELFVVERSDVFVHFFAHRSEHLCQSRNSLVGDRLLFHCNFLLIMLILEIFQPVFKLHFKSVELLKFL